jgi:hypothetical protein
MQNGNQKSGFDQLDKRDAFTIVFVFLKSLATCIVVFTRHTLGPDALGWNGIGALLLILLYGTFANVPEMLAFLCFWLIALAVQRVRTACAIGCGLKLHSRDGGVPWLGYLLQIGKNYRLAIFMEFVIVFAAGLLLCSVSKALGQFVVAGAWSTLLVYLIERRAIQMEIRQMQDAEIDMRTRAEIYQGNHTDF